jgi:hypothetical protein
MSTEGKSEVALLAAAEQTGNQTVPDVFPRLPLPLQQLIVRMLFASDMAVMVTVSKGAQDMCKDYFFDLKNLSVLAGDQRCLPLLLRHCTHLHSFSINLPRQMMDKTFRQLRSASLLQSCSVFDLCVSSCDDDGGAAAAASNNALLYLAARCCRSLRRLPIGDSVNVSANVRAFLRFDSDLVLLRCAGARGCCVARSGSALPAIGIAAGDAVSSRRLRCWVIPRGHVFHARSYQCSAQRAAMRAWN